MRSAFLVLCALLVGCQTGPAKPFALDAPGERRISGSDLIHVALSEADRTRADPIVLFGRSKQSADTGAIWRQVFIGSDGDPVFTIKSAEIRSTFEGLGFVGRDTYVVEGELTIGNETYHAEGSRAAAMKMSAAMREAVELGVVDAASKCRAIIARARDSE